MTEQCTTRSYTRRDETVDANNIRNIGLLAHVDAGKTTTTEQMLFLAGLLRSAGRVDDGTTQTDYLDVERQRGISVRMAATALSWHDVSINLVDTPGHTDFVAEVERALSVLDGAILVISAAEGVQAHTETIWHALRDLGLPTLIFMNKLDRMGAEPARVLAQIKLMLSESIIPIQIEPPAERDFRAVEPLSEAALLERLADCDELALQRYLEGSPDETAWARQRLAELTHAGQAFPLLYGCSLKGIGVSELLDAVVDFLPSPASLTDEPPGGLVFKVERDPVVGRLAYVRMYSGVVLPRQPVSILGRSEPATIGLIRKTHARHHETLSRLAAGDIGVLAGLGNIRAGDIIGDPARVPAVHLMASPVLRVKVRPSGSDEQSRLLAAVRELADEDPRLGVDWVPETRELTVTVMGPIQVEILASLLSTRFGISATFDPPSVIYRETPLGKGQGEFSGKFKGWMRVVFTVEQGEPGSGLKVENHTLHDTLYPKFAEEACHVAADTLTQGLMGWPVTDARVCLIDGRFDPISGVVGDFTAATPMAVMSALAEAGTRLLEPLYEFRLSVPAESGGQVVGELVKMRATFDSPGASSNRLELVGTVPVATSLEFPAKLSSLTGGRGIISLHPGPYQPAPPEIAAVRQRTGENPLDRTRYLLGLRGVIK